MTNTSRTVAEATDGTCFFAEFDEAARTVSFTSESGRGVAAYDYDTFAGITAGLTLDIGQSITLDEQAVAELQQFGNLDAFGLRRR